MPVVVVRQNDLSAEFLLNGVECPPEGGTGRPAPRSIVYRTSAYLGRVATGA